MTINSVMADTNKVDANALSATNTLLYGYDAKALLGGLTDPEAKIMSLLTRIEEVRRESGAWKRKKEKRERSEKRGAREEVSKKGQR